MVVELPITIKIPRAMVVKAKGRKMRKVAPKPMSAHEKALIEDVLFGQPGVLILVLVFIGTGHHLYMATVCKAFQAAYRDSQSESGQEFDTLPEAIFSSPELLDMAWRLGYPVEEEGFSAGKYANVPTLNAAEKMGLELLDTDVTDGAIAGGNIKSLRWLVETQKANLRDNVGNYAASTGNPVSIDFLKHEVGIEFRQRELLAAAAGGSLPAIQYLVKERLRMTPEIGEAAARQGSIPNITWLLRNGCLFNVLSLGRAAAAGGSVEMLIYLRATYPIRYNQRTLHSAVVNRNTEAVKWLAHHGCQIKECLYEEEEDHMVALDEYRDLIAEHQNMK